MSNIAGVGYNRAANSYEYPQGVEIIMTAPRDSTLDCISTGGAY